MINPTPEDLRTIAADMRTAAQANLDAARSAAQLAHLQAHSQQQIVEQLAAAMRAYDNALSVAVGPRTTPHD